ncbi:energy-coupling factor transporter transmembrane component T [Adlercreutzia rubneri]
MEGTLDRGEGAPCVMGADEREGTSPSASARGGALLFAGGEKNRRRVDPRVALVTLVLLNVAVFVSGAKVVELIAVAADALLMVWCHRGRLACAWVAAYAVISLISLACILGGPFFMPVGTCLLMLARLFPTAMFAAALVSTTYLGELAFALQSFGLTGRMTVAVCVGLRFFPTIAREARAVREAMLTRGIRLTPAAIVANPAGLLENFMVPYIHRISLVADELGDAVMARGVETSRPRTSYHELRVTPLDGVVVAVAVLLAAAAVAGKVLS